MRIRWRVCSTPGCGVTYRDGTVSGRCPTHRAAVERQRGTRQARGYGAEHMREGDKALAGPTYCVTCGEAFTAANPATRSHVEAIRDGGTPAGGYQADCARCNYGWVKTGL